MSDFECRNGHLVLVSKKKCDECGSGVYRMDGMTSREIDARERDYDLSRQREEEKNLDIPE